MNARRRRTGRKVRRDHGSDLKNSRKRKNEEKEKEKGEKDQGERKIEENQLKREMKGHRIQHTYVHESRELADSRFVSSKFSSFSLLRRYIRAAGTRVNFWNLILSRGAFEGRNHSHRSANESLFCDFLDSSVVPKHVILFASH